MFTAGKLRAVATICAIQFIGLLDTLIVSVGLPSMATDLGLGPAALQWVLNAYAISYAGFVLLGGRAADLFGSRRTLLAGLALIGAGALGSGASTTTAALLAARAVQGLGAALALPAALALVVTTFAEGPERNRALGAWAASGGLALISGGLLGGLLTEQLGWRAVFLVNVPLVAIAAALALGSPFERRQPAGRSGFDLAGAVTVVLCLALLVYSAGQVQRTGWTLPGPVPLLAAAAALAITFVWIERRSAAPLVRLGLFRLGNIAGANFLALLFPAGFLAPQFLGTLLLQRVLNLGAFETGLCFLPFSVTIFGFTAVAPKLVDRLGVPTVAGAGFALLTGGMVLLSSAGHTSSLLAVLSSFVLLGAGAAIASMALAVASVGGVRHDESGMASGIFSTSLQAGGALTVATLAAVASAGSGPAELEAAALRSGLQAGFLCAAAITLLAAVAAPWLLSGRRRTQLRGKEGETAWQGSLSAHTEGRSAMSTSMAGSSSGRAAGG